MGKQKVLSRIKNNHFDGKGGGACEDAAKSPNKSFQSEESGMSNYRCGVLDELAFH